MGIGGSDLIFSGFIGPKHVVEMSDVNLRNRTMVRSGFGAGGNVQKNVEQGNRIRPPGHRDQDTRCAFQDRVTVDESDYFAKCAVHRSEGWHAMTGTAR